MAVQISAFELSCRNCNDTLKKYRGCTEEPVQPYMLDNKQLSRCPLKLIHPLTFEYLKWYNLFKKGFLPFPGSIGQQPAKLIEIFDIIEREINKLKEKNKE